MEDVGRRFKDVNLKLPDELVVLMTLMSFPFISRPKEEYCKLNKIFSWRLLRETCDKKRWDSKVSRPNYLKDILGSISPEGTAVTTCSCLWSERYPLFLRSTMTGFSWMNLETLFATKKKNKLFSLQTPGNLFIVKERLQSNERDVSIKVRTKLHCHENLQHFLQIREMFKYSPRSALTFLSSLKCGVG